MRNQKKIRIALGWLITVALVGLVWAFRASLGPWARLAAMWWALWIGFKLLTLLAAPPARWKRLSLARTFSYLFLWHGTEPAPFLEDEKSSLPATGRSSLPKASRPAALLWNGARNMFLGALLLAALSRATWLKEAPLAQAWIGLVGLGLLLHMGLADGVTAFWQWRGVAVERLFKFPLASSSVTDFWGGRWNLAFTQLTHSTIFRPLVRRLGGTWGTVAGFLFSGVLHELVVSFPAGAGFGLPTLYFLFQGVCVVLERAWLRRTALLRGPVTAWCWTSAVVLGPLPMMFHPPFLREIVLPLLRFLGATP